MSERRTGTFPCCLPRLFNLAARQKIYRRSTRQTTHRQPSTCSAAKFCDGTGLSNELQKTENEIIGATLTGKLPTTGFFFQFSTENEPLCASARQYRAQRNCTSPRRQNGDNRTERVARATDTASLADTLNLLITYEKVFRFPKIVRADEQHIRLPYALIYLSQFASVSNRQR